MHILIAFDKFKDCMTASEACQIAQEVILKLHPNWQVTIAPFSDGGEGFCEILTRSAYGKIERVPVLGPQLTPQTSQIGYVDIGRLGHRVREILHLPSEGTLAVIEMAQASGLQSIPTDKRDPWIASTYGTGQLIAEAADAGAQEILLGIGGSATNDLGLGALEAIGLQLMDRDGQLIDHATPRDWPRVARLDGEIWPNIPHINIACDVENPLLGPHGATATYGPQKGMRYDDYSAFESTVSTMAKRVCSYFEQSESLMSAPGAGAAGGIGFGLQAACEARMVKGFDLVESWLQLKEKVAAADLIITGEGKFDHSSLQGKGPGSLLREAARQHKHAKIVAGLVESRLELPPKTTADSMAPEGYTRERSIAEGKKLLARKLVQIFSK
ncbi:glycerate kinase [Ruficoccus amylovorans]|uniref:Glycerate kinase n=1 Tax=Ruficoccus amylovorans TaxID=1804625 RepID=A0A842HGX2_9BACT|nr:glycerate kinase [Ruficoccus amylovorans]MBC2595773.1 glycerate kinase [Ruficoccus amylovorans]